MLWAGGACPTTPRKYLVVIGQLQQQRCCFFATDSSLAGCSACLVLHLTFILINICIRVLSFLCGCEAGVLERMPLCPLSSTQVVMDGYVGANYKRSRHCDMCSISRWSLSSVQSWRRVLALAFFQPKVRNFCPSPVLRRSGRKSRRSGLRLGVPPCPYFVRSVHARGLGVSSAV